MLVFFLGTNCVRMWWKTVGRDKDLHVPLSAYISKAWVMPIHFITQARYAKCERKRPWVIHLVLMLSYVTMLVLIMFFLERMAAGPGIDWRVHVFGLAGHRRPAGDDHLRRARPRRRRPSRSTSTRTSPTGCSSSCW